MNKLWLIIQREYVTRVMKKSFILITLLSPLVFVALFTVPALLAIYAGKEQSRVAVSDSSGVFQIPAEESDRVRFELNKGPLDQLKTGFREMGYDGLLYIPALPDTGRVVVEYYSDGQLSLGTRGYLEDQIEENLEAANMTRLGYDAKVLSELRPKVSIKEKELSKDNAGQWVETDKQNSAGIATAIGYAAGFIIYFVLLIYGTMIMRSVMEEKTTRIVEVIISSVKPFQLMMGKIIGVSAVGLTQMILWIVLTTVLMTVATFFLPDVDPAALQESMGPMGNPPPQVEQSEAMEMIGTLMNQNWAYILPLFIFYFIGGYFIYASLFAAVGSAMGDDLGEGQPLTFVAMAPIIIAIVLMSPIIENPTSSLATWASIFPLFSPVLMPARLPFEPPLWEVILSMVVLAGSAFFFVWLSGRIYRVGILMYGKKVTIKELGKWLFYRE